MSADQSHDSAGAAMANERPVLETTSPTRAAALTVGDAERRQLSFLEIAHRLCSVSRLNRLLDGSRPETSAEHSWHLALTAVVLRDHLPHDLDMLTVLEMLAVHDLPEVIAGDVPIFDEQARRDVVADEAVAAEELFGMLPPAAGTRLHDLWREFEHGDSAEARYARAIDRLQPILVHWAGTGEAWASRKITAAQERAIAARVEAHCPELAHLADALVADAIDRGMLASDRDELESNARPDRSSAAPEAGLGR